MAPGAAGTVTIDGLSELDVIGDTVIGTAPMPGVSSGHVGDVTVDGI